MKRVTFLIVLLFTISLALFAHAETPNTKIRIVNISALGSEHELTDEELVKIADIQISENPEIFPAITEFVIKVDGVEVKYIPDVSISNGKLIFSGSMSETERLEYISLLNHNKAGKFDVAIVKPHGTVIKIDKEVVIDYEKRSIKTYDPIHVEEGDVVLVFVKTLVVIVFPDEESNTTPIRIVLPPNNSGRVGKGGSGTTGGGGPGGGGPGGGGPAGGGGPGPAGRP